VRLKQVIIRKGATHHTASHLHPGAAGEEVEDFPNGGVKAATANKRAWGDGGELPTAGCCAISRKWCQQLVAAGKDAPGTCTRSCLRGEWWWRQRRCLWRLGGGESGPGNRGGENCRLQGRGGEV
jgi:hypothetical protein